MFPASSRASCLLLVALFACNSSSGSSTGQIDAAIASPPPVTTALTLVHVDYTTCTVSTTIDVSGSGYLQIRRASDPVSTRDALLALPAKALTAGLALETSFDALTPATDYVVDFLAATSDGSPQADVQSLPLTTLLPNQPPTITLGRELRQNTDPGAVVIPGWASGIAPGPASESSQALTASLTFEADSTLYFDVPPAVDLTTGDFSATVTNGAYGNAVLTLTLHDDGGTQAGGIDTTVVRFSFAVNIPPVAYNELERGPWGSTCIPFKFEVWDVDDDPYSLSYEVLTLPKHGHVVPFPPGSGDTSDILSPVDSSYGPAVGETWCYRPNDRLFVGIDSFTYRAVDPRGGVSITRTVTLVVYE